MNTIENGKDLFTLHFPEFRFTEDFLDDNLYVNFLC